MNDVSPYLIRPNSLTEAMELSKMIAQSNFCPKDMRGKPGDVLLAMQMGSEVGLSPMQSLQSIAVINSRPCIWGDGALAIVIASVNYEYHKEWEEGTIADGTLVAHCLVKRKNSPEYTKSFSMVEAKKANLWSKPGVWQQYPNRMLQMRARAFAIRDQFAEALRGLQTVEEVQDYAVTEKKKNLVTIIQDDIDASQIIDGDTGEITLSLIDSMVKIEMSDTYGKLKNAFADGWRTHTSQESRGKLKAGYDMKKIELDLRVQEFQDELTEAENTTKDKEMDKDESVSNI